MNDRFTKPPSPKLETLKADPVAQINRAVQNGGNRVQSTADHIGTRTNRPAERSNIHPERKLDGSIQTQTAKVGEIVEHPSTSEENIDDLPQEEKEIAEVTKTYKLTPKFNKWCELFFDKSNKDTYLNRTQSAIQAYSLDRKTQYGAARTIGSENYTKLDNVALRIAEERGYTVDKWLDKAWLEMLKGGNVQWHDRVGEVLRFRTPAPVVINQTQNNTLVNVNPEQQKTFNDSFKEFIKAR